MKFQKVAVVYYVETHICPNSSSPNQELECIALVTVAIAIIN